MKRLDINDGNKLIAEFMGMYNPNSKTPYSDPNPGSAMVFVYGQYHNNWEWLMQVVDKLEAPPDPTDEDMTGVRVDIYYRLCRIEYADDDRSYDESLKGERGETKIEAVWKACVKFIQWYNVEFKTNS